MTAYVNKI